MTFLVSPHFTDERLTYLISYRLVGVGFELKSSDSRAYVLNHFHRRISINVGRMVVKVGKVGDNISREKSNRKLTVVFLLLCLAHRQ